MKRQWLITGASGVGQAWRWWLGWSTQRKNVSDFRRLWTSSAWRWCITTGSRGWLWWKAACWSLVFARRSTSSRHGAVWGSPTQQSAAGLCCWRRTGRRSCATKRPSTGHTIAARTTVVKAGRRVPVGVCRRAVFVCLSRQIRSGLEEFHIASTADNILIAVRNVVNQAAMKTWRNHRHGSKTAADILGKYELCLPRKNLSRISKNF